MNKFIQANHTHVVELASDGARKESASSYEEQTTLIDRSKIRFLCVFICLSFLGFIVSLTTTSTSTSLTTIGHALSFTFADTFWIPTSGALASAIFQPICLTLSSVLGNRSLVVISISLFITGSVLAGTASHYPQIIIGASLRGLGVGGVITATDMIVADMVPLRQRAKWMSFLSMSWGFGISLGPIVGGLLAHPRLWRWIFLSNVPACAPLTIAILVMVPRMPRKRSIRAAFAEVDCIGIVLLTGSTAAVLVPCMQAQTAYSWTDWQTLVPIICGLMTLCLFFAYEMHFPKHPLIPLQAVNDKSSIITLICALIHNLTLWSILFFLPFYFETVLKYSPLRTGLATLTQTMSSSVVSVMTGIAITQLCRYRWAVWSGWIFTGIGFGLFWFLKPHNSAAVWIPVNIVAGLGAGMLFTSMSLALQAAVPKKYVATAITLHTFFRSLGSVFGLAVGSAVFQARLKYGLANTAILNDALQSLGLRGNILGSLNLLNAYVRNDTIAALALDEVYTKSLRIVWVTTAAFAGTALLISVNISAYPLDRRDEIEIKDEPAISQPV